MTDNQTSASTDALAPTLAFVREWMATHATTLMQRTADWHTARRYVVGGSSIGAIQGINPYQDVVDFVDQKTSPEAGVTVNTKTQWGTLFEPVIEMSIKQDLQCEIVGQNAFILGGDEYPGCAYSPDGIAVIPCKSAADIGSTGFSDDASTDANTSAEVKPTIALMEFKCPYSRIPNGRYGAPPSYIAQVKMGLELIPIAHHGILVEAVFRRCSWSQLGPTSAHMALRGQPNVTRAPTKCGFIGLAVRGTLNTALATSITLNDVAYSDETPQEKFMREFDKAGFIDNSELPDGDQASCNDFGSCNVNLFESLLALINPGEDLIVQWNGPLLPSGSPTLIHDLGAAVDEFEAAMRAEKCTVIGIVPYKLFPYTKFTKIMPERGYLKPLLPRIAEVLEVVKKCHNAQTPEERRAIRDAFAASIGGGVGDADTADTAAYITHGTLAQPAQDYVGFSDG